MHTNVFSYLIHFHMQKRFYFIFFPCLIPTKPNWITNTTIKTKKMYWHTPPSIHDYISLFYVLLIITYGLSYLQSVSYLLVVLREYTFKVHVFVSSEHSSIITVARLLDRRFPKVQHGFYSRTLNNI